MLCFALQSSDLSWTVLAGIGVVLVVMFLAVFTKWGRTIQSVRTKYFEIERRVDSAEEKASEQGQRIATQEETMKKQQEILERLVQNLATYSVSGFIFALLDGIDRAQRLTGEYKYARDNTMWRNLRFLMDHGYIEEVFPEPNHGQDLRDIVKITPAGHDLITLRQSSSKAAST